MIACVVSGLGEYELRGYPVFDIEVKSYCVLDLESTNNSYILCAP